ncbi:MAG: serine hydrolase domain-containing protein [Bacillota bacterium]
MKLNKYFFLVSLILILAATAAGTVTAAGPADDLAALEAFLDGVIYNQMDTGNIVGVTISVVQDGELILARGYGYADLEAKKAVDPAVTLFRPGSTSKLITWTAVMQLVEEGKLDLNTDISEYLDFTVPARLYKDNHKEPAAPITLTHLMTHTPGFEDTGEDLFVLAEEEFLTLEEYLKKNLPERVFPAGEVMAYSNYGTALAGYIIERISGITFEKYIEKNIFDPLNMENSTFRQPLPEELNDNMARAYKFSSGQYYSGDFELIAASPAGGLSSTAVDMARFMIVHLQKGRRGNTIILNKKTADEMHRRHFSHHPRQDGMTLGFIEQTINGRRLITHGGNTFLFNSGLYLLPEENVGLFVSYSGGGGLEREYLVNAFMDRYYPGADNWEPVLPAGNRERASMYTGEYHPNRSNFSTVEKLLTLFQSAKVRVAGEGFLTLIMPGETLQFVEVEPGFFHGSNSEGTRLINTLVFEATESGQIFMYPGGPALTMAKAPWYGTGSFLGLLSGGSLLLLITAAAGWTVSSAVRLFRKEKKKFQGTAIAARLTAAAFVLVLVIIALMMIGMLSDIDPAYNVPRFFFSGTTVLAPLLSMSRIAALLSGGMFIFTITAWWKKLWTTGGRIHYTILTLSSLGTLWVMFYINLL